MKKAQWVKPSFSGDVADFGPPEKKACTKKKSKNDGFENQLDESKLAKSCTWLETCKPANAAELAPTKSKIIELENWLARAKKNICDSRYLLITGPAGCGKTSSVNLLSKQFGFKITEWVTPIDKVSWMNNEEQAESQLKVFTDFLIRGSRYVSVISSNSQQNSRLILVKDFPNVFLKTPSDFHDILSEFSNKITSPVVFISDGSKAFKLFPPDVINTLKITQISFSAVCFRTVKQILVRLLKQNKISIPSDDVLKEIYLSSGMDLRNCILQTYYKFSVKQPIAKFTFSKSTPPPLEATDNRIELFQTTGRVFYPKIDSVVSKYGYKIMKFTHNPEQMIGFYENNRSDLRFLHHNYVSTFSTIADVSEAADKLSTADLLWASFSDSKLTNRYLAFSVAVRGLMIANKNPNKGYRQFGAPNRDESILQKFDYLKEAKSILSVQGSRDLILDYAPFLKKPLFNLLTEEQKSFFGTYFTNFKSGF